MKLHSLIRLMMVVAVAMVVGPRGWATVYFQDGFNYPVGSAMYTNSPWSDAVLGNTNLGIVAWTNSLTFATNGATLQDFSPAGVAVLETNGTQPKSWFTYSEFGTDLVLQHSNPPAIYTSFLLNFLAPPGVTEVATGQGDANCSIMEMGATNGVSSRGVGGTDLQLGGGTVAWDMMYDAANHYLGVEECAANIRSTNWNVDANVYWTNTATAWYSNSVIATNVTYLVVLKYMVTSNVLAMYINPTPGAAEPAPNLVVYGAGAAFTASYPLGYISLDTANGNNQRPPTVIDSIRVASTWDEVTPAAIVSAPTTITINSSENPSGYNDSVIFTASVLTNGVTAGNSTGSVLFLTNGVLSDTEPLNNGSASTTNSTLAAGTNTITAGYSGDINYLGSSNSLSQVVTEPLASIMTVYRTAGTMLVIDLSDVATNWNDVGGSPVNLTGVNLTTTNDQTLFLLNTTTNNGDLVINSTSFIGYTNGPNVNDQFSYSIADGNGATNIGLVSIVILGTATGQATGIISPSGGSATVSFAGIPGNSYGVQRSTNLASGSGWVTIWTTNAPAGGLFNYTDTFTDLGGVPSSAYYRLSW